MKTKPVQQNQFNKSRFKNWSSSAGSSRALRAPPMIRSQDNGKEQESDNGIVSRRSLLGLTVGSVAFNGGLIIPTIQDG